MQGWYVFTCPIYTDQNPDEIPTIDSNTIYNALHIYTYRLLSYMDDWSENGVRVPLL